MHHQHHSPLTPPPPLQRWCASVPPVSVPRKPLSTCPASGGETASTTQQAGHPAVCSNGCGCSSSLFVFRRSPRRRPPPLLGVRSMSSTRRREARMNHTRCVAARNRMADDIRAPAAQGPTRHMKSKSLRPPLRLKTACSRRSGSVAGGHSRSTFCKEWTPQSLKRSRCAAVLPSSSAYSRANGGGGGGVVPPAVLLCAVISSCCAREVVPLMLRHHPLHFTGPGRGRAPLRQGLGPAATQLQPSH